MFPLLCTCASHVRHRGCSQAGQKTAARSPLHSSHNVVELLGYEGVRAVAAPSDALEGEATLRNGEVKALIGENTRRGASEISGERRTRICFRLWPLAWILLSQAYNTSGYEESVGTMAASRVFI